MSRIRTFSTHYEVVYGRASCTSYTVHDDTITLAVPVKSISARSPRT